MSGPSSRARSKAARAERRPGLITRLSPSLREEIIAAYRAGGTTVAAVARRFGLKHETVRRLVRREGRPTLRDLRRAALDAEVEAHCRRLAAGGLPVTVHALRKAANCGESVARRALASCGIEPARRQPLQAGDAPEVLEIFAKTQSVRQVARRTGYGEGAVRRIVAEAGLPIGPVLGAASDPSVAAARAEPLPPLPADPVIDQSEACAAHLGDLIRVYGTADRPPALQAVTAARLIRDAIRFAASATSDVTAAILGDPPPAIPFETAPSRRSPGISLARVSL